MVIQPTTVTQKPHSWLSRLWVPVLLTIVGVRLWTRAATPPSVSGWILLGTYVVIVPLSWVRALRRAKDN